MELSLLRIKHISFRKAQLNESILLLLLFTILGAINYDIFENIRTWNEIALSFEEANNNKIYALIVTDL